MNGAEADLPVEHQKWRMVRPLDPDRLRAAQLD
jgi:hypothetical protein